MLAGAHLSLTSICQLLTMRSTGCRNAVMYSSGSPPSSTGRVKPLHSTMKKDVLRSVPFIRWDARRVIHRGRCCGPCASAGGMQ